MPDLTIVGGEVDLRSETWITRSKHDLIEKDIVLENYALCSFSVGEAENNLSFLPFLTLVQIYAVSLKLIKTIIIICHENHTIIFHQTSVTTVNVNIGYSENVLHCLMTLHNYYVLLLQQWQQQPQIHLCILWLPRYIFIKFTKDKDPDKHALELRALPKLKQTNVWINQKQGMTQMWDLTASLFYITLLKTCIKLVRLQKQGTQCLGSRSQCLYQAFPI